MSRIWRSRELLVFLLLILLLLLVGMINPNFLRTRSLMHILNSSLILILVSIGEMFVILTKGIDVSVGAILGLSAVILGVTLNAGITLPLAVLLALVVAVLGGMVNAVGITFLRVPPIIMTLGTLGVYRGLMLIITGGSWIETIPTSIKFFANWPLLGIRFFIWVTLIIVIITAFALRRFKKARYFYAVGDNEEGARLMDIPVRKTIFIAYTLAGLFAGIAAVIFVAQIGFVPMQAGNGQELRAIAADVLGGVNLAGGVGTPLSALVGAIFLTAVDSALVFLKVPGYWNNAVGGAILLAAVYLDYRVRRAVASQQRQARAAVRHENSNAPALATATEEEPL